MTKQILKYIFDQIVDTSLYYDGYASPWVHTDGRIYATDGKILLCLDNTEGRSEAFTDNGERHPNVDGLVPPFGEDFQANYHVKLNALESFEGYCNLAGTTISDKVTRMIAKILRLFGMEGAVFGKTDHNRLIFEIVDGDNVTGMLLCVDQAKETNVTSATLPVNDTATRTKFYDALICGIKGAEYFKKCLERDKKEQEEEDKKNFKVYEVTLATSKTICVKADTEEQAKRIALDSAYLLDFDGCFEVEDCEETRRDDVCRSYIGYYSDKGKQYWED